LYSKINLLNYKVKSKKIDKFIKYTKNKKNFKNRLYTENIFLHTYNYYIKYETLEKLINLKNPTNAILLYIKTANILNSDKKTLCFNNGFLLSNEKKRMARYYLLLILAINSFIISFLSFIYGIGIVFIQENYEVNEVFISLVYGFSFLFGFLIMTSDAIRIKDAEKLIKIFNENNLRDD